MATDFTIILEDRPGELARVGEALGDAGVNIEGVSGVVTDGHGVVHLVVEDTPTPRDPPSPGQASRWPARPMRGSWTSAARNNRERWAGSHERSPRPM